MEYNKLSNEIIAKLQALVGAQNVVTDAGQMEIYAHDEVTDPAYHHMPEAVVFAENAQQVAAVVKLANEYHFPVVPRGAGTGLACGAVPIYGGVVLSLEKMNKIIEVNADAMYAVVEPGVRTSDLQAAAKAKGAFYAGDPCSAESCLIGGNLATNAGGSKAVRYGVTRNQVYSLEMVTPTGEIVEVGSRLKKCSTGYCMEQLVMGSEGTLGIITKVTLKLQPMPPYRFDLLAVFDDPFKALDVVPKIMQAGLNPTSMEYMDNSYVRACADYIEFKGAPHYEDGIYVIITVETFSEDELDMKMEQLDEICTACGATDVVEADERVWKVRRSCLEGSKALSKVSTSDDLVVPIDKIAVCLNHLMEVSKQFDFECMCLAHAGDGNLHFNCLKMDMSDEEWEKQLAEFHKICYAYVYSLGGRLSGEHGIGAKKIDALAAYCDPVEMSIMKTIKRAMDPNNILNPGKLIRA